MKKIKYVPVILMILVCLIFSGFTKENDFTIDAGEKFTACLNDSDRLHVAEKLKISDDELKKYLKEKNIEYFAVSDDGKSQIRVSVYDDAFSKSAVSMDRLSDKEINKLAETLTEETKLTYDIYLRNGRKYIEISESLKDSGGEYTATQFVTVENRKLFNITILNAGNSPDDEIINVLDTFKIAKAKEDTGKPVYITVLIISLIVFFSALAVIMVIGIFKDRKNEITE